MSIQVNFVCWSADAVEATIPTEAATPSKAVLLATHAPLTIKRRSDLGSTSSSTAVSERDVLDEFINGVANNGVRVATVIGKSGAGKSHLVRWAEAELARQPKKPGRHIIYLQKTETSLRDVVERLLLDQADPAFDDIRQRLSTMTSGMTLDAMENRILDELAEALRTHEASTPAGKSLVGNSGLALFLRDPLFRPYLLRQGSFINRRARHALYGRDADEPDIPLEFSVADLPLDIGNFAQITDAAAATQKMFRRLGNPAVQNEAVGLLNELLDVAVTRSANLGAGDVYRAFMEIRRRLVGQEIVLLIEDVALIQGVQRDLLDAIVEVGVVQGELKYATVRTLLAVTDGYYADSLPETFKRRAEASSPLYEIDLDLDEEGVADQMLVDFVGRYLNAARVGRSALENASPETPNRCDGCDYKAECHQAFGASSQGYGLYPYNESAVVRAVRACGERDRARLNFNPRKVLSRAIRDVLTDSIDVIEGGTFPAPNFLATESEAAGTPLLPLSVRERIEERYSKEEAGRLEAFVGFWGDGASKQIPSEVAAAFSMPPVPEDLLARDTDLDRRQQSDDEGDTGTRALPASVTRNLDAIDNWANGRSLPAGLARELRAVVRSAILARITWLDPAIKDPDVATLRTAVPVDARGISIEDSGENIQNADPVLVLPRTARTARMFRGLVLLRAGRPELAGEALPRLDALAEGAVEATRQRILAALEVDDASLVAAAAVLLRGAAAANGRWWKRPTDLDLVNAVLWSDPTYERPDLNGRTREWADAYTRYVAVRDEAVKRFLGGIGAAQGATGAIHAVDIERLVPIVRQARKALSTDTQLDVPSWCRDARDKLRALERYADAQLAHWGAVVDRIRRQVPPGVSYAETVTEVVGTVSDGAPVGLVLVNNLPELERRNADAQGFSVEGLAKVEKILVASGSSEALERLALIGGEAGAGIVELADYLESTGAWVDAGLRTVMSGQGATDGLDAAIDDIIREWLQLIEPEREGGEASGN
jgi:hypothetical protein